MKLRISGEEGDEGIMKEEFENNSYLKEREKSDIPMLLSFGRKYCL
ncbi:14601_t:CDS:2 [Funneliformis caledonium]|uniref:14601_t:CDS:1 n=1 Tax=Funneliformis caledonium TaxID=1117310 RepID=A0A9N9DDC2_9GLOM|nr:14601_t:CDS:2 [Funneliformis caledonium]